MRKWLVLLLLLPLASAQTVQMGVEREIPSYSFTFEEGPAPDQPALADTIDRCDNGNLVATAEGIAFTETNTQSGCAYALKSTIAPQGAKTATIFFKADRTIDATGTVERHFRQQVKVGADGQYATYEIFADRSASRNPTEFAIPFGIQERQIDLLWYFEDRGQGIEGVLLPLAINSNSACSSTVSNTMIRFENMPVEARSSTITRPIVNDVEQITSISIDVKPPSIATDKPFIEVKFDVGFTLAGARGPNGAQFTDEQRSELIEESKYLKIPTSIIEQKGYGTYTLVFYSLDLSESEAYLGPVAVMAFAFPLVGIMLSYREYRFTKHRIGDDPIINSGMTWLWRATVAVVLATITWILVTRRVVGMLYWPPNMEDVLYYSILITAGGFMFLYMFLWRRQALMIALDKEIQVRRRTQSTLEQSNRDLEMFAYVASHDMKQPLRMVKFYTRRLKEKYGDKLDADAQDYIDFAADNAERMESLVQGLLEYSRVDSAQFLPDNVDMNNVIDSTRANLQLLIEETGAKVSNDDLGEVQGNYTQLSQLMQNLVENGIKYRGKATPKIHVSRKGHTFRVADNGRGVAAKDLGRIFKLFKQLDVEHDGEGIGLALCRRIVEKHGGKISAKANPDGGTIIEFTLK